ncbi:MAG: PilZ domain-containing protein [Halopseudomonas sp.]|uniref:PilZ domain-containing protein n=1 Tax=Halopseudomonas sp. TaxID=2901191 RepID=UPI0030015163
MQVLPGSSNDHPIEQRQIPRQQLSAYLRVYNSQTDRPFGYIGNVSRMGIMLITELPVMLDQEYQLLLKLPGEDDKPAEPIHFRVRSHWCRADITPGYYDCGFSIVSNPKTFASLATLLQRYFSFSQPVDV